MHNLGRSPVKSLFGSDGPWLHPGLELAKVKLLGLSPAALRLVLGSNWLRLTQTARPITTFSTFSMTATFTEHELGAADRTPRVDPWHAVAAEAQPGL